MKGKKTDDFETENRQQKKHEMVAQTHQLRKQTGEFETISNVFARLPLPRIEKNQYRFLFENIKENVESILSHENNIQILQKKQQVSIDSIHVKLPKYSRFTAEDDLSLQKLGSNNSLHKSLVFMRNQKEIGSTKLEGDIRPFIEDSHYLDFEKSTKEIPHIKLFLEEPYEDPHLPETQASQATLKRHQFEFKSENEISFKSNSFPSTLDIQRRASVLAKVYLLQLYKEQGRKLMLLDKKQEDEMEKKRKIDKIKQQTEIEKMKEGELIEDTDLLKQVYKILQWIDKKMNNLAYEEYLNNNGAKAHDIKKSLEKLRDTMSGQLAPMTKLKILISYKYKKGW